MTDWLLALVPTYGPWLLALCTFGSSLMLPIPSSVLVLAAGGFVAAGDLSATTTAGAVLAGVVAGDQGGFQLGRRGGARLIERLAVKAPPVGRATALLSRHGGLAVFLSRWLFSPLGPYVTLAAGAARLGWLSFTLWDLAGAGVWVAIWLGLGYGFTGNLAAASNLAVSTLGFIAAGVAALGLGWWLIATIRAERASRRPGP